MGIGASHKFYYIIATPTLPLSDQADAYHRIGTMSSVQWETTGMGLLQSRRKHYGIRVSIREKCNEFSPNIRTYKRYLLVIQHIEEKHKQFARLLIISLLAVFLSQIPSDTPLFRSTDAASAVLVGAGDISSCDNNNDEATAKLLDNIPGTVVALGDNVYIDGNYSEFIDCYHPTWGRHKNRTRPVPGNHEYFTPEAAGYFEYFSNVPSYYAYDLGDWRIYALNSEIDVSSTGAQANWLKSDLAVNPRLCVLAYWHTPLWSSRYEDGSDATYEPLWKTLHDAGAELVINGHIHNFEQFKEMNAEGVAASPSLREIVAGTGGVNLDGYVISLPTTEVRNAFTYGVVKLILRPTNYSWQFIPVAGQTFNDSGRTSCH